MGGAVTTRSFAPVDKHGHSNYTPALVSSVEECIAKYRTAAARAFAEADAIQARADDHYRYGARMQYRAEALAEKLREARAS